MTSDKLGKNGLSGNWYVWCFVTTATAAVVLTVFAPALVDLLSARYVDDGKPSSAFADQFGILNTLFSGLAFAGVVVTLWMQKHAVELQRQELEDTREVLSQTRDEAKQQNFDNMFFQMMAMQDRIREFVSYGEKKGRDAINTIAHGVRNGLSPAGCGDTKEEAMRTFEELYEKVVGPYLGHYFRSLFVMTRFVADSGVKDKSQYYRIIRSQLSELELVLVYYNAHGRYGREKAIERYVESDLFQNLPREKLASKSHADWSPALRFLGDPPRNDSEGIAG